MGLDISAYKNLTVKGKVSELDEDEDGIFFYENDGFHGRSEGVDSSLAYNCEKSMRFRAGSYSGYNAWRDQLARLAGYGSAEKAWKKDSGPFWELINFSDCEGTIGSVVSAKLAKDFAEFQEKANSSNDDYFKSLYNSWRKAFEMAQDNGAVKFH